MLVVLRELIELPCLKDRYNSDLWKSHLLFVAMNSLSCASHLFSDILPTFRNISPRVKRVQCPVILNISQNVEITKVWSANCPLDLFWCTLCVLKNFSMYKCLRRPLGLGFLSGFTIGILYGWLMLCLCCFGITKPKVGCNIFKKRKIKEQRLIPSTEYEVSPDLAMRDKVKRNTSQPEVNLTLDDGLSDFTSWADRRTAAVWQWHVEMFYRNVTRQVISACFQHCRHAFSSFSGTAEIQYLDLFFSRLPSLFRSCP